MDSTTQAAVTWDSLHLTESPSVLITVTPLLPLAMAEEKKEMYLNLVSASYGPGAELPLSVDD